MLKEFNDLEWHDARLEKITIDRYNSDKVKNVDSIELTIKWPSQSKNKIVFENVYQANLNMNFGVIAEDSIYIAHIKEESKEAELIKDKWIKLYKGIENLICFEIVTNTTNSNIQIFAMSFSIVEL
ncbi:hypothetical protein Q765_05940 [Flavobacterium rivuli WB 3.3-2 = DSM 21788]|uniref:Uncharacterized protein n=1 Tax=Flavobacterium rivuli WB 3.3-2 = DSM 21788 TaxID=1121895 RepID=A0A0A2MFZ4_9FLAO|nr:hypothetical protein [Flavobacterium rivuli]KGO87210.1 hypothetical protein Q765_05940 [Flavobacterium rivuli WB 3.3-2 = DSM 21788]